MKKCHNCGAQNADDSRFCTECGKPIPQGSVCPHCGASVNDGDVFCQNCGKKLLEISDKDSDNTDCLPFSEDDSKNKLIVPILVGLLALAMICGGFYFYTDYKEKKEERLAREKFVKDSIEMARKDSIKLAEQREKERIEAEKALQKKKMLIPIGIVLDMYKHKDNKNYIIQKLEEYGYSLYKRNDDYEYWTKNVHLKEVKDWRDYTYYEPVEMKGSSAWVGSGEFSISVYSQKDFNEWEKQLRELGYKQQNYDGIPPDEKGWTILGAHANLCKQYVDKKGNVIEFMKDGDGHPGIDVYLVEFAE